MKQSQLLSKLLAAIALVAATGSSAEAAQLAAKPRVTFVGDSVPASIDYVAAARDVLSGSFSVRYDLEVCRRLVAASCTYRGHTPATTLAAVRALGRSLGDVLVVDVGYNEGSAGYATGMRQVIRAARAQGAKAVVWVTLRETRDVYRSTNAAIRREAKRSPDVVIADWDGYSRGRPYFRDDGLHLTPAGAVALARLLRPR